MRRMLCLRAGVIAAAALAGYMAPPTLTSGMVGVSSAEAAEYYTRKRINGRWVNGRFPKADNAARSRHTIRVRHGRRIADVPDSATLTALNAPELRREEPAPARSMSVAAPAAAASAAPVQTMPDMEAALVIAAIGPVAPVEDRTMATEERTVKLRRALQARAVEIAGRVEGSGPDATLSSLARPADVPTPDQIAPAASDVTSSTAPARESAAALVPRSVSFDFETGVKTTVFQSSVVREPFDVATMRTLTLSAPLSR